MISRAGGHYPPIDVWLPALEIHRKSIKLVRGHYHLSTGRLLGPDVDLVTIIREPVARTISHINHSIRHFGLTVEMARKMLDRGHVPLIDNVQSRYLAGVDRVSKPEEILDLNKTFLIGRLSDPVRDGLAKEAIAAADVCAHIATTDNISALAKSMGIELSAEKANEGMSRFEFTEHDIDLIRERNLADIALYEHVKSKERAP
jgi:hypothetical protein